MKRGISNIIENMGINFFKYSNKKESDIRIFEECGLLDSDEIQDIYSNIEVFSSSESYNEPILTRAKISSDNVIRTFSMKSKYEPIDIFKRLYSKFLENNYISFEEIKSNTSDEEEKICFIYLHGFSERNYKNEIKYLFKPLVAEMPEIEILAVHQPYHITRSPKGQPYSGAYIFDSCPIVTIEGIRQSVNDVSQIISYAKEKYKKVIVGGFSLGGHIISFLGTCDDRADLYIMGQAGANLPESLKYLSVCPGIISKRKEWSKKGIDFEELYKPIELLNYSSIIPPEKVVTVAGVYDKLISFNRAEKLRSFFNSKYNIDYTAGHIGFMFEARKVMEEIISIVGDQVG